MKALNGEYLHPCQLDRKVKHDVLQDFAFVTLPCFLCSHNLKLTASLSAYISWIATFFAQITH